MLPVSNRLNEVFFSRLAIFEMTRLLSLKLNLLRLSFLFSLYRHLPSLPTLCLPLSDPGSPLLLSTNIPTPSTELHSTALFKRTRSSTDQSSLARCPPPKLLSLLTWTSPENPHLTKAGTKRVNKAKRHVDESAEFYTAQLLHYGLKPLKTRAPAKAALLKAFEARLSSLVLLAL